jgi:hypothetical protein
MADATIHDPAPPIASSANDEDSGNDSGAESVEMVTYSSLTWGAAKMADGEIPELTDFFKKTTAKLITIIVSWLVTSSLSFLR